MCACVCSLAASVTGVSQADRAGAQQVCSLIPIPLHLPVCPSMFAHAHCVLHRGTPGLCCTWAHCPVLCLTTHTHTHTHTHTLEHTGIRPVPVTGSSRKQQLTSYPSVPRRLDTLSKPSKSDPLESDSPENRASRTHQLNREAERRGLSQHITLISVGYSCWIL